MAKYKDKSFRFADEKTLLKYYEKAFREVQNTILSMVDMEDDISVLQQQSLMAQIGKIMKDLNKETDPLVRELIYSSFDGGKAQTIYDLTNAKSLSEASKLAKFSMLNKNTVDAMLEDTFSDLLQGTQNVENKLKTLVRSVASDTMKTSIVLNQGRRNITKKMRNQLLKKGLSQRIKKDGWVGIIDKAGRRWDLTTYTDTVVLTKMHQAYIAGLKQETKVRNVDLGVISSHGATDACGNYEGAIISLRGETSNYPTYDDLLSSNEIFHPRCMHTVNAIRSPDLLPEPLRDKAEEATKNAVEVSGRHDFDGIYPKTPKNVKPVSKTAKETGKINYKDVNTIKEANEWAKKNIDIDHIDYKGYDIKLANEMNKTLYTLKERYPECSTKWVTTAQERNSAYVKRKVKEKLQGESSLSGFYNTDEKFWTKYYKKQVGTVNGHIYAQSANKGWGVQEGICFNKKFAKDYDLMKQGIANDIKSGFHPVGTENPTSVIVHEYGHQIDNFLKEHDLRSSLNQIYKEYSSQDIQAGLSGYATRNDKEFIAEAFSEYLCNPEPREIATKVGEAIDTALKNYRKRK